jgi:hypothetical protein
MDMSDENNTVTGVTASAAPNDSQVSGESLQSGSTLVTATGENIASADIQTGEGTASSTIPVSDADNKGGEGENGTHKQTKEENSFFKHARERAEKEAQEKYDKQMNDVRAKLKKVLPDGYEDVDEFLAKISDDSTEQEESEEETVSPATQKKEDDLPKGVTEEMLDTLIAKRLEQNPRMKKVLDEIEKKERDDAQATQDKYIIDSFNEIKEKFKDDIKTAEDVPLEVWNMWQLGQSGRSLLSCMKEFRYEQDIEKAKNKGAAAQKGQANSVAHTGAVNSGNGGTVDLQTEVEVPPDTQEMLKKAGIPKDKWASYYQKYHR